MKRSCVVALALALCGCLARMTPYGFSIEPLADILLIGPPVVVEPPSQVVVQPLPPVVVVPDRSVYYYNNLYYYYWGDSWYYGREHRGPWYPLQRQYWPSRLERRDYERGRRGHDRQGGDMERR